MYLGIDIGGTFVKIGVSTALGELIQKEKRPTSHTKEVFLSDLVRIIADYEAIFELQGIGISMPGVIDPNGTLITAGALGFLEGFELLTYLKQFTQLPITIDNDANCAAIAERWLGNAQGIDHYVALVLGTGVGCGIVTGGKLFKGAKGMAGEAGWMITSDLPDQGEIEETSTLNYKASVVLGLCHIYNRLKGQKDPSHQAIHDARIIMDTRESDPEAAEATRIFYQSIATMIINVDSFINPEIIIIGGGITEHPAFFQGLETSLSQLVARHKSYRFLQDKTTAQIKLAKLKNDAGLLGAIYQVMASQ